MRASLILALLSPALLLGAAAWGLEAAGEEDAALSRGAEVLDRRMARAPKARAVVVGNSKVGTDLDLRAIAGALGLAPTELVDLGVHGTGASTWLSVLDLRVYAHDYAPETVIIYGSPRRMLQVAPEGSKEIGQLGVQLQGGPPERVSALRARINGGRLNQWRGTASTLRDAALGGWRDVVVGGLFDPGTELRARGAAVAEASLEKVFPVGVSASRAAVGPVRAEVDTDTSVAAEDSLAGDIARLVAAHAGQAVFVPAPVGPSFATQEVGVVADEVASLRAVIDAAGGVWVDLPHDVLPASAYGDGMHMRPAGRLSFAPILVDALKAAGAPGPLHSTTPAAVHAPVTMTREGTAPRVDLAPVAADAQACPRRMDLGPWLPLAEDALSAAGAGGATPLEVYADDVRLPFVSRQAELGEACAPGVLFRNGRMLVSAPVGAKVQLGFAEALPLVSRDGQQTRWLTPGTDVVVELPADAGEVRVEGRVAGPPGRVTAQRGEGAEVELKGGASARAAVVPGTGPLRLRAAAGGPAMLLDRVEVRDAGGRWYAVGGPRRSYSASLFGEITAGSPPPVPGEPLAVTATKDPTRWLVDARDRGLPGEAEVEAAVGARCTPISLVATPPLGEAWTVDPRTPKVGLVAKAPGATPPATVTLAYAEERGCHGRDAIWLYPGDKISLAVPAPALRTFQARAGAVVLNAHPFGPVGALRWVLRKGEEIVGEGVVGGDAWTAPVRQPLTTPFAHPAPALTLELSLESGLLLLLAADVTDAASP